MEFSFGKLLIRVFGSRNERLLKRYRRVVEAVNAFEPKVQGLADVQLRQRTEEIRTQIREGKLNLADVIPETMAIIRESMDRQIGIRNIFNPDETFDPDLLDDKLLEVYDGVQRQMIASGESWKTVTIPVELYDGVRKVYPESRPPFRCRPFDVQIVGGLVLYEGKIAEMATGEGKTFVAPIACFLKCLAGFHCHVVTVNDYLVKRDSMWVEPSFAALGLSVGYIQSDIEPGGEQRKKAYQCDVTYGTNAEFGFDFLRDNMKERLDLQVQGPLDFAIVDEVDSILIDEARTPLIISGAAHDDAPKYRAADAVARKVLELAKPWDAAAKAADASKRAIKAAEGDEEKAKAKKDHAGVEAAKARMEAAEKAMAEAEERKTGLTQFYEVEMDRKSVHLTHQGIAAAQDAAGVGSFYVGNNMEWPHLMEQALRAHVVYERDRDYVVERGQSGGLEVVIVDEYTGRKMVGRQWSEGLHQAVEAKERVPIKQETQTLATITLQNFFKMYKFLGGMTGTAQTEAEEFNKIYRLEVVTIPTNRPTIRKDSDDRVYRTEREKWESIIDEIKLYSDAGRPVLVGTTSVEKSEMLSNMLTRKYGIQHEVLNAKNHEKEASIVAMAGHTHENSFKQQVGNVTIATNMAGRGTDIKLATETIWDVEVKGANEKATYALKQRGAGTVQEIDDQHPLGGVFQIHSGVRTVGGLHVIGTERHTARRIDNQLRGRSGRQGDPGSSRFYVSLQDDLMKMFASEWTIRVLSWLGMEEGMAIEDKRISKGILNAQKKVEERNYLARKNLLDYDEVMDHQRTTFYGMRQRVLRGADIDVVIWDMISQSISDAVTKYVVEDYIANCVVEWARTTFEVGLETEDVMGIHHFEELEHLLKAKAKVEAEGNIASTMGEFMGEEVDNPSGWDTRGLSEWALNRFQVNLPQSQIQKMSAADLEEQFRVAAVEQIENRDCAELTRYLEPLFSEKELCAWAATKFGVEIDAKDLMADAERGVRKSSQEIITLIEQRARQAYAVREIIYPVGQALTYAAGGPDNPQINNPYAAEYVRNWAAAKYQIQMDLDHIMQTPVEALHDELVIVHREFVVEGKLASEVDAMLVEQKSPEAIAAAFNQRWGTALTVDQVKDAQADDGGVREMLIKRGKLVLRQELTDLEQYVLISIFDQAWKDHLYAMDMLKGSIGLHAFAERDPRVLFKKEGFRFFQEMMIGVRDKVTDLIFRVNVVGQTKAKNAYNILAATHQEVESYGVSETIAVAQEMHEAAGQSQGEGGRVKTMVREAPKVGRNDPCPCGSGKKYKKCCGVDAE